MRSDRFVILNGVVERSDESDGTMRRPWHAEVWVGRSRDGELPFPSVGRGIGKAPHVALNRAVKKAVAEVKRT